MTVLTVISCGAIKAPYATMAAQLYRGTFFTVSWRWAHAVSPVGDIRIFSAKHGLVAPTTWLEPYELRMGAPGSISAASVARQLQDIENLDSIRAVIGQSYRRILNDAAASTGVQVEYPLSSLPDQRRGYQMQAMNAHVREIQATQ